jgi:hypothetical protein
MGTSVGEYPSCLVSLAIYLFIIFEANQEQMTFGGLSEGML